MNDDAIGVAMQVSAIFEQLGVPYMIGGSVASTVWGEPRFTRDVDFVAQLETQHVSPLKRALGDDWYADEDSIREAVQHRSSFNIIRLKRMIKVDVFVPSDSGFHASKWTRLRHEAIDPDSDRLIPITSPEDIVLQKLDWYRAGGEVSEQQWKDVTTLLSIRERDLDTTYLELWAERLKLTALLDRAWRDARA